MSSYLKNIAMVMVLLSMAAVGMALKLDLYHWSLGVATVVFMGLNAIFAIYPLYRFKSRNPISVYLGGMVVRLGVMGAVLILVILAGGLDRNDLLAMTLTAMGSFLAYLAVELRHFLNNNAFLASR